MKTKHWIILILLVAGIVFLVMRATAQTASPAILLCSGAHTTCTFPAGAPSAMVATDGFWYTATGTSPINLAAQQAGGVTSIAINGSAAKTGIVNFTVGGTTSAPNTAITVQ